MIPDKLYINLKILGRIQKNGKITRSYDGIIALETSGFHQSIKRFMHYDSRKQSVFEINSIINECFNIIHNLLNLKHMQEKYANTAEYIKTCEEIYIIVNHLEEACSGISNLKFTYINDINIEAQLEIIIAKINNVIRDTRNSLNRYISHMSLSNQQLFRGSDISISDQKDISVNSNIEENFEECKTL